MASRDNLACKPFANDTMKRKRSSTPPHRLTGVLKQVRALKVQFDKAHADGMTALDRHNFDALCDAIVRERTAIAQQYAVFVGSRRKRLAQTVKRPNRQTGKGPKRS